MPKARTPNPSSSTPELWEDRDIKDFCGEIRAKYGKHWAFIPSILHDAIVAEQVVRVVTASSLARNNPIGARDVVALNRRIREKLFERDAG